MNILYLCADPGIPVRGHKGAAVHVRAMCAAFARAGHTVTLIAARLGPDDGPRPDARLIDASGPDDGSGREASATARVVAQAQAVLASAGFDLIYERYALLSDAGAQLAERTGLPLVLEVNAPLIDEAREHRGLADVEAAAAVARRQFANAARIAVVSDALRAYVIGLGASPDRVEVVPNGVDPAAFHPAVSGARLREQLGLQGRRVVGFVGRPRPWHDLGTLLAAVERLHAQDPAYVLLLVGEMPDDLRALAEARPEWVRLTGAVAHDQVPAHIGAMHVAVSSHHARDDFYFSPLKLYEYLACAVPTVAADVGQQAQVLREVDGGWLYPAGDTAALAGQIARVFAEPDAALAMAWRGAAHVLAHYTWDANAARVCGWIKPAAGETARVKHRTPIVDGRLRQRLFKATRADLATPLLAAALGARAAESFAVSGIDILKYKPRRRAVLRYRLSGAPWPRLIGKVFRDERAGRLAAIQGHLWDAGFGLAAADRIRVAEPIAVVPELRAFLQEQAPGNTLNERFAAGEDLTTSVDRAAQAVAKLHAVAWRDEWTPLSAYTLADEVEHLAEYGADLSVARPTLGADVASLLAALRGWAEQLPALDALCPVHRDFYYSQVLIDGADLALIDFDLISLGDPAIDVANFMAHLAFLSLDHRGDAGLLAPLAERFIDAYRQRRVTDDGFRARVDFYIAATYFRLMNVVVGRPALAPLLETLHRLTLQALLPA